MRRGLLTAALTAALTASAVSAAQADAEQDAIVDSVSAYLNSVATMTGEFVQIDPDGVIREGEFFLRRPGRLRFQYERPHTYKVIADGFWVAIIEDEDDRNIDRLPVSETPLNLLLQENVDLLGENAISDVERSDDQLRLTAVDPDSEQSGEVVMVFDAQPLQLRQWIITDPQGLTTTIALRASQTNVRIDPALFVIPEGGGDGGGFNDDD